MSRSRSPSSKSPQRSPERRRRSSSKDVQVVNCLYVGNIDKKVDDDKMQQIFKKYGELEYCYIVYEPTSSHQGREQKISRGYGFVKLTTMDDTIKAKNQLDGLQLYNKRIRVELSKRSRPRQPTPGKYLGRKRSPPRRHSHRRRSHSFQSSDSYKRRGERKHRHHRYDRERGDYSPERRRQHSRSRSKERGHRSRRRSHSYDRQRRR